MDYKSEAEELEEQLKFLKKVIITPLAIALAISLILLLIKSF